MKTEQTPRTQRETLFYLDRQDETSPYILIEAGKLEAERAALKLSLRELEGMHSYHHPTCPGGCPFDEAARAARAAIAHDEN